MTCRYGTNVAFNIINKQTLNLFPMPYAIATWQLGTACPLSHVGAHQKLTPTPPCSCQRPVRADAVGNEAAASATGDGLPCPCVVASGPVPHRWACGGMRKFQSDGNQLFPYREVDRAGMQGSVVVTHAYLTYDASYAVHIQVFSVALSYPLLGKAYPCAWSFYV